MQTPNYPAQIAAQTGLALARVTAAIALLDEGNTIPFIARYRKEVTGTLDEEQLRIIAYALEKLRALDERRATILKSIEEQGQLTPHLQAQLLAAASKTDLEDLYQPYKPKRKTRASVAREKGLAPLADAILAQARGQNPAQLAAQFLTADVPTLEEALAGARDILAETISDHPEVRKKTREKAMQWGSTKTEKVPDAEDPKGTYRDYYEFEFRVDKIRPHQILAINRGEEEKILRVKITLPERDWREAVTSVFRPDPRSPLAEHLNLAIEDAAERLLLPAIERDVRRALTEQAENHAIKVFSENLRNLLNQPPLAGHTILGIDPGFRTGCKIAVVDSTGKVLNTATIYPHVVVNAEPQRERDRALKILTALCIQHKVTLIAIGNGTASRETEQLVADFLSNLPSPTGREVGGEGKVRYLIVNEAGASVYSASPLARAELPELDVSMRGAVSIARRVLDPLAELVKIDPKSIGVGLYQHDVDQKELASALDGVVETVVNRVGVDINTASPALLTHVAGIGPKLSEKIVAYRNEKGPFPNRKAIQKVSGLGPKAFEQAAGFLRITTGDEPLDASAIHPESYPIAREVLRRAGITLLTPAKDRQIALARLLARTLVEKLAAELGTGLPTLKDILEQILRPGRDPRQDAPPPILRSDVLSMDDLVTGMKLKGTVRNVVDFGAFVDIGVKQDGLIHQSKLPQGTKLRVGQVIEVEILNVDQERGRIGLGFVKG
ncbi:MAG: Tex family protein [Anaerolineales bacterium]